MEAPVYIEKNNPFHNYLKSHICNNASRSYGIKNRFVKIFAVVAAAFNWLACSWIRISLYGHLHLRRHVSITGLLLKNISRRLSKGF